MLISEKFSLPPLGFSDTEKLLDFPSQDMKNSPVQILSNILWMIYILTDDFLILIPIVDFANGE